MVRDAVKNLQAKRQVTVVLDANGTTEKLIELVQNSGMTTNRVMNILLKYAIDHAKIGRVYHTTVVFDNEEPQEAE